MIRMLCATFLIFCCVNQVHAKTPWEQYLDLPNENNAKRVTDIAYSAVTGGASKNYVARDLRILSIQINSGDPAALQLAFRLREKADGGLLEDLDAMLGHAVRAHPMQFLEQTARQEIPVAAIESIILTPGLEYTDRPAARIYELEMRYEAIRILSPSNVAVERVQKECLRILKSKIDHERLKLSERLKHRD